MTIDELKAALDAIPDNGPINKARRREIQKEIFQLIRNSEQK